MFSREISVVLILLQLYQHASLPSSLREAVASVRSPGGGGSRWCRTSITKLTYLGIHALTTPPGWKQIGRDGGRGGGQGGGEYIHAKTRRTHGPVAPAANDSALAGGAAATSGTAPTAGTASTRGVRLPHVSKKGFMGCGESEWWAGKCRVHTRSALEGDFRANKGSNYYAEHVRPKKGEPRYL